MKKGIAFSELLVIIIAIFVVAIIIAITAGFVKKVM